MEAVKSGALAVLVILSMLLTLQVWRGTDAGRGIDGAGGSDAHAPGANGQEGARQRVPAAEIIAPVEMVFAIAGIDEGSGLAAGSSRSKALDWVGCAYASEAYEALWGSEGLLAGSRLGEGLPPAATEPFLRQPLDEPWRLAGAIDIALPSGVDAETFLRAWGVDVSEEAASFLKNPPEAAGGSSAPEGVPPDAAGWRVILALARGTRDEEARWYLAPLGPAGEVRGAFRLEGAGPGKAEWALQKVREQLGRPAEAASLGLVSYAYLLPGQLAPKAKLVRGGWVSEDPFGAGPRFAVGAERVDLSLVVDSFFFDRTLVRTIEELDGAIICTDGRRGLRVYPSGMVEYTVARGPGSRDPVQVSTKTAGSGPLSAALETAGAFLGTRGGWPEGALLSSVTGYGPDWRMDFNWHYRGCRMALPVPAMSLVVSEAEVMGYNRLNLQVVQAAAGGRGKPNGQGGEVMGMLAAAAKGFSQTWRGEEARIVAVKPVWLVLETPRPDRPADAAPAWMFLDENREAVFVDAVTGEVWRRSSGRFESAGA